MTRQEEIWEGIKLVIGTQRKNGFAGSDDYIASLIYNNLHSQGLMIKVEKELPERMFLAGYGYIQGHQLQVLLDKIGCEAVESLIGEEK